MAPFHNCAYGEEVLSPEPRWGLQRRPPQPQPVSTETRETPTKAVRQIVGPSSAWPRVGHRGGPAPHLLDLSPPLPGLAHPLHPQSPCPPRPLRLNLNIPLPQSPPCLPLPGLSRDPLCTRRLSPLGTSLGFLLPVPPQWQVLRFVGPQPQDRARGRAAVGHGLVCANG